MRVLRRIANQVRNGEKKVMTDLEVRVFLKMPSVECLVRQKRLLFIGRLKNYAPLSPLALLQARFNGAKPRWIETIISDFQIRKEQLPGKLAELPDPCVAAAPWVDSASKFPGEWKQIVNMYHTCVS